MKISLPLPGNLTSRPNFMLGAQFAKGPSLEKIRLSMIPQSGD